MSEERCIFKRGKLRCEDAAETDYGFCKRHTKTAQAVKAKKEYEENLKREEEAASSTSESGDSSEQSSEDSSEKSSSGKDSSSEDSSNDSVDEPLKRTTKQKPSNIPSEPSRKHQPEAPPSRPRIEEITDDFRSQMKIGDSNGKRSTHDEVDSRDETRRHSKPTHRKSTDKKSSYTIRPNAWGRFEEKETGIVFDPKKKIAYGVQDYKSGKVLPLSKKHAKICEEKRWSYRRLDPDDSSSSSDSDESSSDR